MEARVSARRPLLLLITKATRQSIQCGQFAIDSCWRTISTISSWHLLPFRLAHTHTHARALSFSLSGVRLPSKMNGFSGFGRP